MDEEQLTKIKENARIRKQESRARKSKEACQAELLANDDVDADFNSLQLVRNIKS